MAAKKRRFKLSTAIRRGIKLDGRKVRHSLFKVSQKTGKIVGCCALGAGALGRGFKPVIVREMTTILRDGLYRNIPLYRVSNDGDGFVAAKFYEAEDAYIGHYGRSIADDNDMNGLSREEIADRLEAIGH